MINRRLPALNYTSSVLATTHNLCIITLCSATLATHYMCLEQPTICACNYIWSVLSNTICVYYKLWPFNDFDQPGK